MPAKKKTVKKKPTPTQRLEEAVTAATNALLNLSNRAQSAVSASGSYAEDRVRLQAQRDDAEAERDGLLTIIGQAERSGGLTRRSPRRG